MLYALDDIEDVRFFGGNVERIKINPQERKTNVELIKPMILFTFNVLMV